MTVKQESFIVIKVTISGYLIRIRKCSLALLIANLKPTASCIICFLRGDFQYKKFPKRRQKHERIRPIKDNFQPQGF